ncbi:MAG: TRAP transporter substrate-binding protein [Betaproteobacteria bacterium]|nr:TRAP transporter substrate-binding protein [Betaproteobacteria bacterium]MBI2959901.1 TRAP transporter substrate-binding protein [Betaproteobacteria bacterium]
MFKRTLALLLAALTAAAGTSAWSQMKEIPWGTSAVGSAGHKALVALAEVLNREMKDYRITVQPTAGAIVTVKGYATGQFEGYYGADIAFYELANDVNRFKGFKASMKRQPVQSFWAFTLEVGTAIHSRDRGKFKKWGDLSGAPVFTGPLPWDVRAHLERAYGALGLKHQYRQVDLSAAGSLLQSDGIEGFIIYTSGEASTPPWITEASLATDWAALNPSTEELAKLKKAGFAVTEVKPEVFKKDVHASSVVLLPFFYGFHVGLEVPEADLYRMLTVIEKRAGELVKADAGFAQIARDMPGFQRRGVLSSIDFVPIHPGLAKYMREKGVWDAKWDARIAKK